MRYRVQQFIKAITASISEEEKEWVESYLSPKESTLFFKLKIYEQRHCIDVTKLLAIQTEENRELVRLGLLHDIGKTKCPLNPIEKSIIVILDKMTKGAIKKWTSLKMVKCYYDHAEIGYQLLKNLDHYDEEFLGSIRKHHSQRVEMVSKNEGSLENETQNNKCQKDCPLELLKKADDLC